MDKKLNNMQPFNVELLPLTKYIFFTGKGGVGKTSTACATAIALADSGKKIMLISTDPASNLQDVFETELTNKGVEIDGVRNLVVANFDPEQAAFEYKESVVGPYRGKLPNPVIQNMEEQLSGSCTVEIAAFNEFSDFITDEDKADEYDHILFDTAPTGHTLRMLQLPSAWRDFMDESTHGASCLGQLSGLEGKQQVYQSAVSNLSNPELTTLVLVTRPEMSPLKEADRASKELEQIGVKNQALIVNALLTQANDTLSQSIYDKQQVALGDMSNRLQKLTTYYIPLRSYNLGGLSHLRAMLTDDRVDQQSPVEKVDLPSLSTITHHLNETNKRVIFTMGKGGVGKTTLAATIALDLADQGKNVHLTTTDPASHLHHVLDDRSNIRMSYIDEEKELKTYRESVLAKARETMGEDDLAYIEEDLRSPCTQEIAVFRAFAELVDHSDEEVVVIDTAPTGHTLLLLDATESYHREIERTSGDTPPSVQRLLPKLRDPDHTAVVIVTYPEQTPVYEAGRLADDLTRAKIDNKWWVVNASLLASGTTDPLLQAKASQERKWIEEVKRKSDNRYAVVSYDTTELNGDHLKNLLTV
ncbi:arsenite efflux ATP-binding protein ArsA [Pelagirhabdus alkalitolerans]|uniref:Arsenite efflux ATP-binding protein ArsA n=2 Tax=Pelagirhabdus alkalitolerans TaxID=1612202 RepID=A0A1G6N9F1_9BACI|nr:arsenite efflux ATP-binding protein ArsA [Pelagirhabdus alkalitolerans]